MSHQSIKVIVPRRVAAPRGARWAAEAALWLARGWQRLRACAAKSKSIQVAA